MQTQGTKKENLHRNNFFPTDILPSLIIVKEPEGVAQTCSIKNLFLEISQNSQENTCARVSFLIKLQAVGCF